MQKFIEQLKNEKYGTLIAVCARPGNGRRTFAIGLANTLSQQGEAVCFYSFSCSLTGLDETINPQVRKLNSLTSPILPGAFVIVDDLTAGFLALPPSARDAAKTALLSWLKELATYNNLRVVVTDTFARHIGPPPLSPNSRKNCHAVYELRRQADATICLAELPRT